MVFYVAMLGNYRLKQYKGDVTAQSMLSLVAITALFFLLALSTEYFSTSSVLMRRH
jgi:hypothetical protein